MSETPQTPATTALVPVNFEDQTMALFEANFAPELAEKLTFYKGVAEHVATIKVTDEASLAIADTWNKELLREADALEEVRAAGPGALNRLGRKMGAAFKPLKDLLETSSANLKHEIGTYVIAKKKEQEAQYQAAAQQHAAGDHGAAQVSLELAAAANTSAPLGNSTKEVWVVERYEPALMILSTPEFPGLVPDEKSIDAYLAKLPSTQQPALPGVICKLVTRVTTRR
jgi:hypothetical protein